METIHETYTRILCSNCKNRYKCQEELRKRLDNTIRCDKYETENKIQRKKQPANWQVWQYILYKLYDKKM
jgi:hypothetical protein